MKKIFLLMVLVGFVTSSKAQEAKTKKGFCKITEVTKDNSLATNKTKVTIKFIGPNGKPVKSNVKFVYNNDSLFPVINEQGKYSITVVPGKYKMRFAVPYWHEVYSDSIICHKQSFMTVLVKFEAKDF